MSFKFRMGDVRFWFGVAAATVVALLIFPGIDVAAYFLLRPVEYWQKFAFVAGAVVTAFPEGIAAFFAWVGIATLFGL